MLRPLAVLLGVAVVSGAAVDAEWEAFKRVYKKTYKGKRDEKARYKLFLESKGRVEALNKLNGQPAFGINWMSDRYESEKHKKGLKKPKDFKPSAPVKDFTPTMRSPRSIDWRYTKAVTPVKNQGQCGCCWAFSATEAIESQMILQTGAAYDFTLSPQQICSCAPSSGAYGCDGCNGGFTEGAYEYVKTTVGLANGFYIPYTQSLTQSEGTASCPLEKVLEINGEDEQLSGSYAQVSGYSYATPPCTSGACTHQDLRSLAAALEQGPLSVCVNAGVWSDYTGGVLTAAACGSMAADAQDHCVMAVGFNTTAPTPYWIVRNSWATTWGEQGYIYLEMSQNTCGIADDATIPDVKVDMTREEQAAAAVKKEAMFQLAAQGSSTLVVV
uniref:Peptidase C1A papain C-terminal domain-containing protein n=1 Tax=Alexandrium monilatum TaxID=311494 RepID=A0A7S4S0F8_9DINO